MFADVIVKAEGLPVIHSVHIKIRMRLCLSMTLLKYEPKRKREQRHNMLQKSSNGDIHLMAVGKDPDCNQRICKALKKPNETVKGKHFHLPRQSRTMREMAGMMGFSKTDVVAGSWPIFLPGSSARMHPWNAPMLESDLETHQGIL